MGMKGVSKRAAYVIDANGTVQHAEVLESPGDMPDFAKINQVLESLGSKASV
jgi:peroxiredoxin